jgi:3-(3-hydroxy-phenyl)propionate hydroxylase
MDVPSVDVLIVGAGPVGMMLAGELALARIDVAIVERRTSQDLAGMRAGGLHIRTIEVLDQRGIADRFVSQGQRYQVARFHGRTLDISDFPTRRNYFLGLSQNHIERILAEWVGELGVPIYRGRDVVNCAQDESGVNVELSDGQCLRVAYLVGCDGARSVIRKTAGIEFVGWEPTKSWLIAEAEWVQEPEWGFRYDAYGTYALGKMEDARRVRVVLTERELKIGRQPTLHEVSETLRAVYGTDYGIHSPTWISRFTDMCRQALTYRDRRVLLAGDAAHIHPPMGGQGLNIGVQDAVNLGWKLAQVVKGTSPQTLLDTYHAERRPIAARVLLNTMALVALQRQDDRTKALGQIVSEFLAMDGPRKHIAAEMSGLSVHYNLGEGHPLLGHRMPDLDLDTADGPQRVFTFLHSARPMLLTFGELVVGLDIAPWTDRVQVVEAAYNGAWELPVLGVVTAPSAVLVRPDGHVAWVGGRTHMGLPAALTTWFGPPTTA